MNTHDKIVKCRSCGYIGPCDPTCCERPDYDGATAEEAWHAAIEADRQRGGEPVPNGYDTPYNLGWAAGWDAHKRANPVVKESLTVAEPVKEQATACKVDLQSGLCETVKEVSDMDVESIVKEVLAKQFGDGDGDYTHEDRVFFSEFSRILLARYGQHAQPAASVEPVQGERFLRAWVNLKELPGGMMVGPERFGPIAASTSCWITTSEVEAERMKARGPILEVWAHAAPVAAQPSVPDEWLSDQYGDEFDDMTAGQGYRKGWNDCRAAMLEAAPEVKP